MRYVSVPQVVEPHRLDGRGFRRETLGEGVRIDLTPERLNILEQGTGLRVEDAGRHIALVGPPRRIEEIVLNLLAGP